ncbi:MAG: rod shape-determining protein MreC [Candidatus Marinimicrobia bacterium CG08_land_8_20_14_0_20_45_22]|nr:MAG: rod shape-determining protein MreC [Candidatus Marinimicrobia bacterium CG08_land_8_20_14_0_20_45_22]
MWEKFLNLIVSFYEYILFLFLIGISFVVLLLNENPQVRSLQGDVSNVLSFINLPNIWINDLSNVVEENAKLKEENLQLTLLNVQMKEAWLENQRLRNNLGFMDTTQLVVVPAKVLNLGISPICNSILINIGKMQGVKPDMAVISLKGIVGKTVSVGEKTTLVQIFLDVNFRISVKFQDSRVFGIMQWNPNGYAEVNEVPKTVSIVQGEKVVTSGYSQIYPPNICIGEVVETKSSDNALFQTVTVKPSVNINEIEEVFVILSNSCYEN